MTENARSTSVTQDSGSDIEVLGISSEPHLSETESSSDGSTIQEPIQVSETANGKLTSLVSGSFQHNSGTNTPLDDSQATDDDDGFVIVNYPQDYSLPQRSVTTMTPAAAIDDGRSEMTLNSSYDQIFYSTVSTDLSEPIQSASSACTDSLPNEGSKVVLPDSSPTFHFVMSTVHVDHHHHLEQTLSDDQEERACLESYVVLD